MMRIQDEMDERLEITLMGCASEECLSYAVGKIEAIDAMNKASQRIAELREEIKYLKSGDSF